MAQPRIGLLAVDLRSLDKAVDLRTGRRAHGRITEKLRLAPDEKWLYRPLRQVVVDRQMARLDIPLQAVPVVCQVMHRLTQYALRRDLRVRLVEPTFQLIEDLGKNRLRKNVL